MSSISHVEPVKLFVVTIHRDPAILEQSIDLLKQRWGPADFVSQDFAFDITDYYEQEMGTALLRRFYSFERLISPDLIVDAKLHCMQIEENYAIDARRQVNLDPGYLDTYKLVLSSAKYGGQKIYLRDGIYADMTMVMYKGKWDSFLWGFPDFKSGKYHDTLYKIRDLYKKQRRFTVMNPEQ